MRLALKILAGVLILAALGCLMQGIIAIIGNAQSEPLTITCAQLGQSGPGSNGHVTVTNFHACTDLIVVTGGDGKTNWEEAFVPLVPAADPTKRDFRVLLDTRDINTQDKLSELDHAQSITGVINNAVQGPSDQAKNLLANSYPGVDLQKCYFIEHNMTVITRAQGACLIIAALVLVAITVIVIKKIPAAKTAAPPAAGPVSEKY